MMQPFLLRHCTFHAILDSCNVHSNSAWLNWCSVYYCCSSCRVKTFLFSFVFLPEQNKIVCFSVCTSWADDIKNVSEMTQLYFLGEGGGMRSGDSWEWPCAEYKCCRRATISLCALIALLILGAGSHSGFKLLGQGGNCRAEPPACYREPWCSAAPCLLLRNLQLSCSCLQAASRFA